MLLLLLGFSRAVLLTLSTFCNWNRRWHWLRATRVVAGFLFQFQHSFDSRVCFEFAVIHESVDKEWLDNIRANSPVHLQRTMRDDDNRPVLTPGEIVACNEEPGTGGAASTHSTTNAS